MANATTETPAVTNPASTNPNVAQQEFNLTGARTGFESSLSNWAGPYVHGDARSWYGARKPAL
jgi:hypothetical protein